MCSSVKEVFLFLYITVFGAIIGSFLNVVADRVPQGESVVTPPSHCPHCQKRLQPLDLIPVMSWILLRGRCRHCQTRISWQYPLVEAVTAILWALVYGRYGWTGETIVGLLFVSFLIPLSVIDWQEWILPDRLTYPLIIIALLLRIWIREEPYGFYLAGGILGAGILWFLAWISPYLFGKEGMGLGDVKLMAGIGAVIGLTNILLALFFASVLGLAAALLLKNRGMAQEGYIPFGPFLSLGGVIVYLFGSSIWDAYLSFF
jgi:prepilin signal peptidase PulO-like enzyme (type II secretory pathway)